MVFCFRFFGNRSYCFDRMGQFEKALQDADMAISLAPDWPKGYFRRGRALAGLKVCFLYSDLLPDRVSLIFRVLCLINRVYRLTYFYWSGHLTNNVAMLSFFFMSCDLPNYIEKSCEKTTHTCPLVPTVMWKWLSRILKGGLWKFCWTSWLRNIHQVDLAYCCIICMSQYWFFVV